MRVASSEPGQCLVTGGSGLVGRETVAVLSRAGWQVTTLGRSEMVAPGALAHIRCDLAKANPPAEQLAGFDAIVHLVAAVPGDPPARFHAVNVDAAGRLAAAAREAGVARFVLLSSTRAVTANGARDTITDTTEPEPGDPYGRSKRAGEQAVLSAFPGASILRPPLILGPGLRGAMARLVRLARSRWPLPVAGLTAPRTYITTTDLADAIRHVLSAEVPPGRAMLVASQPALSVAEIVRLVRAARGQAARSFALPTPFLARLVSLALGPDAAAALTKPLVVMPSTLPASGWRPPGDTRAAIALLAGKEA